MKLRVSKTPLISTLISNSGLYPTPVITLNRPNASAANRGALTAADWTTFNSKVSSQWVTTGSNIYYNTGNVIIGTATNVGDSTLQVSCTGTTHATFDSTNANGAALLFKRSGTTFGAIGNSGVMGAGIVDDFELRTSLGRSIHLLTDSGRLTIKSTGNIGINTGTPAASALLDVTSTTQGFLPPRMTTTQKNAIASPAAGLVIYDTTLNKLCVRVAAAWQTITSA